MGKKTLTKQEKAVLVVCWVAILGAVAYIAYIGLMTATGKGDPEMIFGIITALGFIAIAVICCVVLTATPEEIRGAQEQAWDDSYLNPKHHPRDRTKPGSLD